MPDTFYRRNLPHIHPEGYPLFITFRLANTLPLEIVSELKIEREREIKLISNQSSSELYEIKKKYFDRYDNWLDRCTSGPRWLDNKKIARIIQNKICEMDNLQYRLIAYCIMSNHVHMLIDRCVGEMAHRIEKNAKYPVTETLRLLKGNTARYCNIALERTGNF